MYYKLLPKGTEIFQYHNLSYKAKTNARNQIIVSDLKYYDEEKNAHKVLIKTNIHRVVNNAKLHYLIRKRKHITKLMNDLTYIEKYISENRCHFTVDGEYITYMS